MSARRGEYRNHGGAAHYVSTGSTVDELDRIRRARRRRRDGHVRRRQVVVRFSDEEWRQIADRAGMADLAIGAWIGQIAVEAATDRRETAGLPDLLRLHTDVQRLHGVASQDELVALVRRLDAAVDAVVAEIERGRR